MGGRPSCADESDIEDQMLYVGTMASTATEPEKLHMSDLQLPSANRPRPPAPANQSHGRARTVAEGGHSTATAQQRRHEAAAAGTWQQCQAQAQGPRGGLVVGDRGRCMGSVWVCVERSESGAALRHTMVQSHLRAAGCCVGVAIETIVC